MVSRHSNCLHGIVSQCNFSQEVPQCYEPNPTSHFLPVPDDDDLYITSWTRDNEIDVVQSFLDDLFTLFATPNELNRTIKLWMLKTMKCAHTLHGRLRCNVTGQHNTFWNINHSQISVCDFKTVNILKVFDFSQILILRLLLMMMTLLLM